jgi:hypothetical protein
MIPVIVNVFNRLTTTKKLCSQLSEMPDVKITIIDNNSDWAPLLEWYETECEHDVVRLAENMGHHAPWKSGVVASFSNEEYYCVTDCDLDLENIPLDADSKISALSSIHGQAWNKKIRCKSSY